ncbi:SgcJ/EcaC family oxidoreductase [Draconibacterium sp.]|nr:SgcJ/EcaC family oxidoreductase [Draconibacterium sp.]
MKKTITLLALLSILFFTCCENENKQTEKDVEAIKELLKKYEEAAANGDAVAYINLYTEDVIWAQPNAPVAKSKAEILERLKPLMENLNIQLDESAFEIIVEDDFAYAMSDVTGTFTQKSDGLVIPVKNTALRIFRKEKDGWRISRQIYNSKLPK